MNKMNNKLAPETDQDIKFINYINILSATYNLQIDWEHSDIEKKILCFAGSASPDLIEAFSLKISEHFDLVVD